MKNYIDASEVQLKQLENLAANYEGIIYMINLFKYVPETGLRSFNEYEKFTKKYVSESLGGRLILRSKYLMTFVGDDDWDEILIVEYPSARLFLSMLSNDMYLKAKEHRLKAFTNWRLYVTKKL